ncbi:MAG TPA: hypothetical protein VN933_02605 [Candidatus Eremiobacteraceae bacterium]|jgi:hypothetical protein|nr:hypothetical protein [Candidatus Eremiobacteraceae bacterium]
MHYPQTNAGVRIVGLRGKRRIAAELLALVYIATIAEVAIATGAVYVLFPELAALSHDVFTRPRGSWASAPVLLVITPVLTSVVGTLVTRNLPYGYWSVMLTVCGALAIVLALRSPIAPAISAGLLPLALGVRSTWYPPGIVFGTILLAVLSTIWKRMSDDPLQNKIVASEDEDTASGTESYWRLLPLLVLVLAAVFVVKLTNLRFVLFPPLVVIGFEMFVHTKHCPWATRTLSLPIVCMLTATGGLFCRRNLGVGPAGSISSMAIGVLVLRIFDLHVPPALAVALLPQVIDSPTVLYPVAVAIGTSLLSGSFVLYSRVLRPRFED